VKIDGDIFDNIFLAILIFIAGISLNNCVTEEYVNQNLSPECAVEYYTPKELRDVSQK